MEFMSGLPHISLHFNSIYVIMDRLTKSTYFIPIHIFFSVGRLVYIYVLEIVHLHSLPVSIISYRGTMFTSSFLQNFQRELGTQVDHSIDFHHQIDNRSEQTIQVLQDMLRVYVMNFGDQWEKHLAIVEFSYNNSYFLSIEMAAFEALDSRHFQSPIGWFVNLQVKPHSTDLLLESPDKFQATQHRPQATQSRQRSYANRILLP